MSTHTEGLARGVLLISFCQACTNVRFPITAVCPNCYDDHPPRWRTVPAHGTLWSFAIFHKRYRPDFSLPTPYAVTIVELDCGAKLYANMPDTPHEDLRVGMAVQGYFDTDERDNSPLLRFHRDDPGDI